MNDWSVPTYRGLVSLFLSIPLFLSLPAYHSVSPFLTPSLSQEGGRTGLKNQGRSARRAPRTIRFRSDRPRRRRRRRRATVNTQTRTNGRRHFSWHTALPSRRPRESDPKRANSVDSDTRSRGRVHATPPARWTDPPLGRRCILRVLGGGSSPLPSSVRYNRAISRWRYVSILLYR